MHLSTQRKHNIWVADKHKYICIVCIFVRFSELSVTYRPGVAGARSNLTANKN